MDQAPVVVDYRPEWTNQATETINLLLNNLGDAAVRIEHIGSTAIPSRPANDVLDLQVSVVDLDVAAQAFDGPLQALGCSSGSSNHSSSCRIEVLIATIRARDAASIGVEVVEKFLVLDEPFSKPRTILLAEFVRQILPP